MISKVTFQSPLFKEKETKKTKELSAKNYGNVRHFCADAPIAETVVLQDFGSAYSN